ncbi:unnamed protein product, partial [marine sediment metagenome]
PKLDKDNVNQEMLEYLIQHERTEKPSSDTFYKILVTQKPSLIKQIFSKWPEFKNENLTSKLRIDGNFRDFVFQSNPNEMFYNDIEKTEYLLSLYNFSNDELLARLYGKIVKLNNDGIIHHLSLTLAARNKLFSDPQHPVPLSKILHAIYDKVSNRELAPASGILNLAIKQYFELLPYFFSLSALVATVIMMLKLHDDSRERTRYTEQLQTCLNEIDRIPKLSPALNEFFNQFSEEILSNGLSDPLSHNPIFLSAVILSDFQTYSASATLFKYYFRDNNPSMFTNQPITPFKYARNINLIHGI